MRILDPWMTMVDKVNDFFCKILWVGIFLNAVIMLFEVFMRYILRAPTIWANELSLFIFGAYIVLIGGFLTSQRIHTNVDILYSHFSIRGKALADIVTFPFTFIYTSAMLIFGISFAWNSLEKFEHTITAWGPPVYPVKILIPLGALLLLTQSVVVLIRDIRRMLSKQ